MDRGDPCFTSSGWMLRSLFPAPKRTAQRSFPLASPPSCLVTWAHRLRASSWLHFLPVIVPLTSLSPMTFYRPRAAVGQLHRRKQRWREFLGLRRLCCPVPLFCGPPSGMLNSYRSDVDPTRLPIETCRHAGLTPRDLKSGRKPRQLCRVLSIVMPGGSRDVSESRAGKLMALERKANGLVALCTNVNQSTSRDA